jgi:hypothetical protein
MKRSIVPAQITTVEDHIFGGLSPHQLVLVLSPLCIGFLAYAVLPPNLHLSLYKIILVVVLEALGAALSVRVKDKILLLWIVIILRYNLRPRYYVYNKNDAYLRDMVWSGVEATETTKSAQPKTIVPELPKLPLADVVRVRAIIDDPRSKLRFDTGKDGRLRVFIQEIK